MHNTHTKPTLAEALRHYAPVMAFAVLCIVLAYGVYIFYFSQTIDVQKNVTPYTSSTTAEAGLPRALPVHLRIPKINVDTTFVEPLGLNEDQTIQVPESYEQVGWYKNGASPGEVGTSVILGHVDTVSGPAVFYSLGQLSKGDEFTIERSDGEVVTFVVDELHRYSQDNFPTERVYGKTNTPTLRLITCTGIFDKGVQKYSQNLVVYAVLKDGGEQ